MARKTRRLSRSGRSKIERALACGWRPMSGVGVGEFLQLRRARRVKRGGG